MNYPKLGGVILLTVIAALLFAAAWARGVWPEKLNAAQSFARLFVVLVGGAFLFLAFVALLNWLAYNANARLAERMRAEAITERVKVLELISRLTPEQLAAVNAAGIGLEFLPGSDGAIPYELRTPGGNVPASFVAEFMSVSTPTNTAPVRTWGEGTEKRTYARWLTDAFVMLGWAEAAAGNQSARWINRGAAEAALERMGG